MFFTVSKSTFVMLDICSGVTPLLYILLIRLASPRFSARFSAPSISSFIISLNAWHIPESLLISSYSSLLADTLACRTASISSRSHVSFVLTEFCKNVSTSSLSALSDKTRKLLCNVLLSSFATTICTGNSVLPVI